MNFKNKILLFVLFVLKEFALTFTTSAELEHEYDITKHLNEAIINVLQGVNPNSSVRLISRMRNDAKGKYECHDAQRLRPFSTKIYFRNINVTIWEPESTPKVFCDYKKNKVSILNDHLVFNVMGSVDLSAKKSCAIFKTIAKFKDITITASETKSSFFKNKLQINFFYNQLLYNQLTLPWLDERFHYKKKDLLIKKVRSVIPSMIHDTLNHNEKFQQVIHSSFCYRPMQKIVTAYPSVLIDEKHYFYFIPKVTFYGVNLINVKIKGLTNFESLKPNVTFGNSAYTLIVKKVRGSMNLDNQEYQNFKFYEMIFNIENLFITVDFESKRLVVEARNYTVMQTSTDPPKVSVFSTVIMQSIESVISSALMPALEVPELNDLDDESFIHESEASAEQTTPELPSKSYPTTRTRTTKSSTPQASTQISTTERKTTNPQPRTTESSTRLRTKTQADAKTTKPSSSTESPQDETTSSEELLTELSEDLDTNIRNFIEKKGNETETKPSEEVEEDSYEYDITFHNVSIKLIPGTPYPKQIKCDLFKGLNIGYQVNAIPSGNIQLSNKGKAININFLANFTEIKISVEKQTNGSKEDETCQFQIYSNQDIKVISPPKKNDTGLNGDLETKKEINRSAMSMMKERFTRTLKPIACLPFDFCSHSVQILDDFLQSFVDKVLEKCSLRRNTTMTK